MSSAEAPKRAVGVRVRKIHGELYLASGADAWRLSDVGASIWELADGSRSVEEITAAITDEYSVDAASALADTREFVDELIDKQLMVWRPRG